MNDGHVLLVFTQPLLHGLHDLEEEGQRTRAVVGEAKVEHLHVIKEMILVSTSAPAMEREGDCAYPVVELGIVVLLAAQVEDHEVLGVIEPQEGGHVCKLGTSSSS
jgi:hypothetical protein